MNIYPTRKRVIQLAISGVVSFIALPILFLLFMPVVSIITGLAEGNERLNFIATLLAALPSVICNGMAVIVAILHLRNPSVTAAARKFPIIVCVICSLIAAYSLYQVLG